MNLSMPVLSQPPRSVPLSTRLVVRFGGPLAMFGWLFGGFGMIFAIAFGGHGDFTSWLVFRGQLERSPGVIVSSEDTRASEGGGKHSKGTPILAHHYKFNFGGVDYEGVSYITGGGHRDGQAVTVEFTAGNPAKARIQGMRREMFGPAVVFVLIFPLVGFGVVAFGLWTGRRNVWLLVNGQIAQARNTGKEATSTRVNNRTVYKVWFEFTDQRGVTQKTFARTSKPEQLEGHAFEPLFYDEAQPARAALLRDLPGNLTLDARGEIAACSMRALIGVVWPPLLALAFTVGGVLLARVM